MATAATSARSRRVLPKTEFRIGQLASSREMLIAEGELASQFGGRGPLLIRLTRLVSPLPKFQQPLGDIASIKPPQAPGSRPSLNNSINEPDAAREHLGVSGGHWDRDGRGRYNRLS
jgi:hypothetical protein